MTLTFNKRLGNCLDPLFYQTTSNKYSIFLSYSKLSIYIFKSTRRRVKNRETETCASKFKWFWFIASSFLICCNSLIIFLFHQNILPRIQSVLINAWISVWRIVGIWIYTVKSQRFLLLLSTSKLYEQSMRLLTFNLGLSLHPFSFSTS